MALEREPWRVAISSCRTGRWRGVIGRKRRPKASGVGEFSARSPSGMMQQFSQARLQSIAAVKSDQLALNLDPVRRQDANLIGGVGRLQRDGGPAAAESLQRG